MTCFAVNSPLTQWDDAVALNLGSYKTRDLIPEMAQNTQCKQRGDDMRTTEGVVDSDIKPRTKDMLTLKDRHF